MRSWEAMDLCQASIPLGNVFMKIIYCLFVLDGHRREAAASSQGWPSCRDEWALQTALVCQCLPH